MSSPDLAMFPELLLTRLVQAEPAERSGRSDDQWVSLIQDIPEGGRNDTLTKVAGKLYRENPPGLARELLHSLNETRCDPPLAHDEVERIADSIERREGEKANDDPLTAARTLVEAWRADGADDLKIPALIDQVNADVLAAGVQPSTHALIQRLIEGETRLSPRKQGLLPARRPHVPAESNSARSIGLGPAYDVSTTGIPHANLSNVVAALEYAGSNIHFDEHRQKIVGPDGKGWTDDDNRALTLDLQRNQGLPRVTVQTVSQGVETFAHQHRRNSLLEYLNLQEWDGTPRLETFCTRALGTDDNPYTRAAGSNLLKAMVVRAYKPGSKVDQVPTLEGPQGAGKSSAIRALGDPWFVEVSASTDQKDFYIGFQGAWVAELPELSALSRSEVSSIKRAITCQSDTFRAPYDRVAREHPRTCVFIGSTNDEAYLKDSTGGRRWLPLKTGRIDVPYIQAMRGQLFAEARHRLQAGATWWELPPEATDEQEARRQVDPWEDLLAAHFEQHPTDRVVVYDLLTFPLGIDAGRMTRDIQMRVARILKLQGFRRVDGWLNGAKRKFWTREVGSLKAAQ